MMPRLFKLFVVKWFYRFGTVLFILLPLTSQGASSSGTGFFISSDGFVATNYHVIEGAKEIIVRDARGKVLTASAVLTDSANDLAVIKVDGSGYPSLPIRNSGEVKKGAAVFTIGFPNATIQGRESKVTEGILSSLSGIGGEPNSFQISVPIQPGNSGGPLIDMTGAVVGLTAAKLGQMYMLKHGGTLPENVNYAVKSNYLSELLSTDANVRFVRATGSKILSLTTLAAQADKAIVFIAVSREDKNMGKSPSGNAGELPRYQRDAHALENFRKGKEVFDKRNYPEALLRFGKAAELGHAGAAEHLGFMYKEGLGVPKEFSEALRWYIRAAELGDITAQNNLGAIYKNGQGVAKNDAEAVKWYRKAAEQGSATAQTWIGIAYSRGQGIDKDEHEAVRWFRKSAEQGNANAQNWLGAAFMFGRGVEKDEAVAVKWNRKAAEQGNANAYYALGYSYMNGRGVEKDEAEGVRWLRKASEHGNADAHFRLAVAYINGHGVAKDEAEAVKLYRKAAEKGHERAQQELKKLGS